MSSCQTWCPRCLWKPSPGGLSMGDPTLPKRSPRVAPCLPLPSSRKRAPGNDRLRCAGYVVHPFRTKSFEKPETKEKRGGNVKRERACFQGWALMVAPLAGKGGRKGAPFGQRANGGVVQATGAGQDRGCEQGPGCDWP